MTKSSGVCVVALREMRLMQILLRHINIVHSYGVSLNGQNVQFVMECYPMTLKQLIGEPIVPNACRRYTTHLLTGIEFLHSCAIMHRDLKPENLLIGTDENLKIADFGLAREVISGDRTYTKNMVTLWYRSHEVLMGLKYLYDVDIWSIACIVSEMATSKPLFAGGDETELLLMHKGVISESSDVTTSKLCARMSGADPTWTRRVAEFMSLMFVPAARRPSATVALRHSFVSDRESY